MQISGMCRMKDERVAVRRILARITQLTTSHRLNAMSQLLVLSGLRRLENVVREESLRMPVTIDLMENRVIRDYFLQGERQGAKGEALSLLTRLLEHRFGPLSEEATRKLSGADLATLETWSVRLLDASTLEEVLNSTLP